MGFSPLANMRLRIPEQGRFWQRDRPISGVGIHHNSGVDAYGEASNPARVVSANYWITNAGDIIPNIDESHRAFTSGHPDYPAGAQADMRNITIEVSNSPAGVKSKSWAISDAARSALVRLIADIYRRHGLGTVKRSATDGVGVHSDWVPTECPGDYIRDDLPNIIDEANAINNGGLTMSEYKKIDAKLDKIYDHISNQARVTRGSSQLGWIKKGLQRLLLRDPVVNVNVDAKELAAEIREAFGDDLAADVAAELTIVTKEQNR